MLSVAYRTNPSGGASSKQFAPRNASTLEFTGIREAHETLDNDWLWGLCCVHLLPSSDQAPGSANNEAARSEVRRRSVASLSGQSIYGQAGGRTGRVMEKSWKMSVAGSERLTMPDTYLNRCAASRRAPCCGVGTHYNNLRQAAQDGKGERTGEPRGWSGMATPSLARRSRRR